MTRAQRARKVALALLIGWIAGTLLSLPFDLYEVLRNTVGDWALMVASVGYGLALWVVWTLAISAVAGVGAAIPVALLIRPALLLKHRALTLVISGGAGGGVVLAAFWGSWYVASGELAALIEYFVFTVVFAVVTADVYLRLLLAANRLEPAMA